MEHLTIVAVIIIFVVLNGLTYISGVLATPTGSIFLGTVHWPGDYFYYLSQFVQGKNSWFSGYDLFTSDFKSRTLVGWVNIFLGRIFYLLGVNHFLAYQLSIVIFAIGFLSLSYLIIREIFPGEAEEEGDKGDKRDKREGRKRMIAFLLFVISNAFPKIGYEGGRFSLSYYDFWFNNGLPFNRLGGVPHHLIARTSIAAALLLALLWWKRGKGGKWKKWGILLGLVFLGFVLASIDPVHWGLVVVVMFMVWLLIWFATLQQRIFQTRPVTSGCASFGHSKASWVKRVAEHLGRSSKLLLSGWQLLLFLPSLLFFLGGFPMALYLKSLFAKPPYSQLAIWEATQQIHPTFWQFILGNGPVAILAILGLPFFSRRRTLAKMLALLFTFITLGVYFSPIPEKLAIVNVRFLPAITTLFLACFAAEAIWQLTQRFGKKQNLAAAFTLGIVVLIIAPTYFLQIKKRLAVDTINSYFYISQKAYAAYNFAEKTSAPPDTFLVIWPFNWSFPAVTGRRVFEGHNLLTVDHEKKEKETREFFFGNMEKREMQELLTREKIDYIMTYPWTRNIDELEMVEKIYDSGYLAVYRVRNF